MTKHLTIIQDPAYGRPVIGIGSHLVSCLPKRYRHNDRRFCFRPVESSLPNALSLPGGFVLVTRGILEFCEWDNDEIAFVLSHEIGHILHNDSSSRFITQFAVSAVSSLSVVRGLTDLVVRQLMKTLFTAAYSHKQEFAADAFGVELVKRSGYDPKGGFRFFERLLEAVGSLEKLEHCFQFFMGHPATRERIDNMTRTLDEIDRRRKEAIRK